MLKRGGCKFYSIRNQYNTHLLPSHFPHKIDLAQSTNLDTGSGKMIDNGQARCKKQHYPYMETLCMHMYIYKETSNT